MVRKTPGNSTRSPKKSKRSDDASPSSHHLTLTERAPSSSVHKRNLCFVSFPIIFMFNVLHALLYQLFVLLRFVYCSSSDFLLRRSSKAQAKANEGAVTAAQAHESEAAMAQLVPRSSGPGPGDPLLAKQVTSLSDIFLELVRLCCRCLCGCARWNETVSETSPQEGV